MPIYYDPTEDRVGTRLPHEVIDISKPIVGLEKRTGSDLIITPSPLVVSDILKPPGSIMWKDILQDSMLIQRKTGLDLISSIDDMSNILLRMVEARREMEEIGRTPPMCWLLVMGFYESTFDGFVKLGDGTVTKMRWESLSGTLDAWQVRGGFIKIHHVHWEPQIIDWLMDWDAKLPSIRDNREKIVFHEYQSLVKYSDKRLTVLMGLPGMGFKTARAILDEHGTVNNSIAWIMGSGQGISGIGKKKIESWREVLDGKEK